MHWRKVLLWTLSAAILTAPVYLSGINVTAAPIMQENKTEVDKIKEEKKEPVSGYEEEFQKNNEKVSETMKKFHGQHKMKAVVKQLHGHWTMEC